MTFVDYAELVWRKLGAGATQQAVGEEIGWSRGAVSQYAMLQKIDGRAWEIVATAVASVATSDDAGSTEQTEKMVAFSERLLRAIVPLRAEQQIELVRELADGRINKNKFARRADDYRVRNDAEAWLRAQLGEIDAQLIEDGGEQVRRGLYDDEWRDAKAVHRV